PSLSRFLLERRPTDAPVPRQRSPREQRPQHSLHPRSIFLQSGISQVPKGEWPHDRRVNADQQHHRQHHKQHHHHSHGKAFKYQHAPVFIRPGRALRLVCSWFLGNSRQASSGIENKDNGPPSPSYFRPPRCAAHILRITRRGSTRTTFCRRTYSTVIVMDMGRRAPALSIFALWAAVAGAQSASLSVTVTDENGVAVPSARVFLDVPNAPQRCQTDFAGRCRFLLPAPGTYPLRVEKEGFYALVQSSVQVSQNSAWDVTLSHQQE